jgi:GT2 family glycosyltransferase
MIVAVVLHFRREAMTRQCIASLEASAVPVRIVVVDNASGDGSIERLQASFPQHAFVHTGDNLGYAGGNNAGIAWALARRATAVLIINDDATVDETAIGLLSQALERNPAAAAAAPTIVHADPEQTVWWAGGRWDAWRVSGHHIGYGRPLAKVLSQSVDAPALPTDCVSGCCVLIRAKAIERDGAFREDFASYVEDLELSLRYRRAGWQLVHEERARARHHVPFPEPVPAAWKIERRDRNRRTVARLHLSPVARLRFLLIFCVTRPVLALRYAAGGDVSRARAILRGWLA